MGTRLYVGNLAYSTTEESLREAFGAGGRTVTNVFVVTDRETGRPRGFAFVEMKTEEDAKAAIAAMDGQQLDGRTLRVNEAQERGAGGPPRRDDRGPPRSGGFDRDRGGGGGGGGGRFNDRGPPRDGGGFRSERPSFDRGGGGDRGGGFDRDRGPGGGGDRGGGFDRDRGPGGGGGFRGPGGGGRDFRDARGPTPADIPAEPVPDRNPADRKKKDKGRDSKRGGGWDDDDFDGDEGGGGGRRRF